MLNRVILWSLHNRVVVLVLTGILFAYGIFAAKTAPLDVFPEFAPPQVVIQTEAPGLSPDEVEALVTIPLEQEINGTSNVVSVRSSSAVGLSVITVVFTDQTNVITARQLIAEKLSLAASRLPQGVGSPEMAPITSSSSTILMIGLTSKSLPPMELRTIADWIIKPRLLAVPGIAKVVVYGGGVKQYQVLVSPKKLRTYGITLQQVIEAARRSNSMAGAGFAFSPNQQLVIRGEGRINSLEDLKNTLVVSRDGVPITLQQVAKVQFGPGLKVGEATINGEDGVILMISKQPWFNTLSVTENLEKALEELEEAIPQEVILYPALFRQASFIETSIRNMTQALWQGGVLVAVVLFLFLFNTRSALISLVAIPLSLLVAIIILRLFGVTLNTMTLGGLAIAIGEVVDDAIIDVENIFRRLRENRRAGYPRPSLEVVLRASLEVRNSVVYATFIVVLVFLPIFFLSGIQGKIFAPLGYAYILSILASLLVAILVTPALCLLLLPEAAQKVEESFLVRGLKRFYRPIIGKVLQHPIRIILASFLLFIGALSIFPFLGGEFLPEFNEGNFIIHMAGLPGTSLEESVRMGKIVARELLKNPAVASVGQQAGRAELADDTWGPDYSELVVALKETELDMEEILKDIRERLSRIPGFYFNIMQFLSERIDEVISGTTAQVVVKVFGPDLSVLREKVAEIQGVLAGIPGVADLQAEQQVDVPEIKIKFNRDMAARYGLSVGELVDIVTAIFRGVHVSQVYEGQRVYDLVVRYEDTTGFNLDEIQDTWIDTPSGFKIPLRKVAEISVENGPNTINRENVSRRMLVQCNVTGRDVVGFVNEVKQKVREKVRFPTGYYVEYSGQFESQEQAKREILLLGIVSAVGIFLLLYMSFRSLGLSLLIMTNLPLALIGGIVAAFLSGGILSVGSMIGFVTLFGITTRNGIMLISHYHHLLAEEGMSFGKELIIRGAMERLSPILMTALVTGLGLLPIAISVGEPGRELEQPMAVIILGGLVTSTLLNMIVIPALYFKFGERTSRSLQREQVSRSVQPVY
jgi:CzcA family heavy metal efflux pump